MNIKKIGSGALITCCLLGGGLMMSAPAFAEVPQSVQTGIDDAVSTVEALDVLALAALTVALTPLGAMLTLRFLNMVLSRV